MYKPKASKLKLPKLAQLFEGEKIALKNEGRYFSTLSDHEGEKGRLNETHLKNLLRKHLPEKYGIGTGFIVSSLTMNDVNYQHPQLDIVIYDKLNNAPLYQSEAFGLYQVEIVYGYIEVKTTLNKKEIKNAFNVNARVRDLAKHKFYADIEPDDIPPRFYIFSYNSHGSAVTSKANIRSALSDQRDAHPHGIYMLDKDLLVGRVALNNRDTIEIWEREGDLAFSAFLITIMEHLETMIPRVKFSEKLSIPYGTCLPRADNKRYVTVNRP